ncbi:type I restriction-modification system subunit M N-terminal domain-containing protein [Vibrio furnissii]|nr:type I restriction-modification system subunit M N-terminal domain-containing protein [Vibrio furnissii]MCG6267581.1 type I restriction-modification system subunit M N-terminal domain-containing protein [Vibrio furnissii]
MTNNNFSQTAAFIWSVADLLRGDFKQSQYGRVILPLERSLWLKVRGVCARGNGRE